MIRWISYLFWKIDILSDISLQVFDQQLISAWSMQPVMLNEVHDWEFVSRKVSIAFRSPRSKPWFYFDCLSSNFLFVILSREEKEKASPPLTLLLFFLSLFIERRDSFQFCRSDSLSLHVSRCFFTNVFCPSSSHYIVSMTRRNCTVKTTIISN